MNKVSFWKGFFVGVLAFVLLGVLAYNKIVVQPDVLLTEITVNDLNGKKVDLTSYSRKPLVLNMWATWCAPCIQEFPYFEKIKQEYKDEVNFVMISDESSDIVKGFLSRNSFSFNFLQSDKDISENGITVRPVTYFFTLLEF